ncbi:MFS transporter [Streptomyces sp. B1866]|uniref:MFS transporter n=1 Tax=Streptomyces sp. B1866 TaxID=3075431 RepID=UPI002890A3AA|nr:MFS transporter [Streptomyces sp. B1866]MDT3397460.1 MFS transporter [Streptomyces sp. B1866]
MTETTQAAGPPPAPAHTGPPARSPGPWRRMWLWGTAHAVDDLYQGLVPACVPYFVLDRGYGYVAAAGLTLAAALGSSVPQPFIGLAVDRYRLGWLAGAGVAVAGVGLGLSGLVQPYPAVWALILLSGIGVAMFHPAAGKAARAAAGDSAAAMSVFAAGGSVGFLLAPVLATPLLVAMGVTATAVFIPPAVVVGVALLRHRPRPPAARSAARAGTDQWAPFLVLTAIETVRSVAFFGVLTFIELFWIRHLHTGRGAAGAALAGFLLGGVAGTLLGGRIADRLGLVRTVQLGGVLAVPALLGLRLAPGPVAPFVFAVLAGVALNIPFAVLVKLGQDYLPTRPGTAAGVTLGLAVSIGGLIAPALGVAAEHWGPQGVLWILCAIPVAALALGVFLTEPESGQTAEPAEAGG